MYYHCPRCGAFGLTHTAEVMLPNWLEKDVRNATILGHMLRRMQIAQEWPLIDSAILERIMKAERLPTVQEQADNLIRWLGDHGPGPGEVVTVSFLEHGAILGAYSIDGFLFVVKGLIDSGPLYGSIAGGGRASVFLTFAGWQRYQELLRGAPSGRNAFMAMPYGDTALDTIVADYFRPAVKQTGFDLKRLDDEPKAGLMDARMMLAIQAAWFLIADLTHGNHGAYWEAGYAAGLGKPVIYTCEESVWKDRKSHFDTNHHLHVVWKATDMAPAMQLLKATIRFTIPEAKREDG